VLGNAFHENVGVVVDTHVSRLSQRLGLTDHEDAAKIEQDLMEVVPREEWTLWAHLLIHHGRAICQARKPKCEECPLLPHCPAGEKFVKEK
jgi:endonuclease-3